MHLHHKNYILVVSFFITHFNYGNSDPKIQVDKLFCETGYHINYQYNVSKEDHDTCIKATLFHETYEPEGRTTFVDFSYERTNYYDSPPVTASQSGDKDITGLSSSPEISSPEPLSSPISSSHQDREFDHNDYIGRQRDKSYDDYKNQRFEGDSSNDVYSSADPKPYSSHPLYQENHSLLYLWFKNKKDTWFGPSKQILEHNRNEYVYEKEQENSYHKHFIAKPTIQNRMTPRYQLVQEMLTSEIQQAYVEHHQALAHSENKEFLKIMKKRNNPFEKSLAGGGMMPHTCKLKDSTRGFMSAYGVDFPEYYEVYASDIQYHLTREIIANFDMLADLATTHIHNQNLYSFIQAGVYMTAMAQGYNQQYKLLDTISSTNTSHGLLYCLQGMISSGVDRCQKLATSLAFFNCEASKYIKAAAKGVACGIITSEVSTAILSTAGFFSSFIAPQLTAAVYTGVATVAGPVAICAGFACYALLVTESARCGYYYTTQDLEKLQIESENIQNFASSFYNFDQAPEKHVENLAMVATTFGWPSVRESVFDALQGIQKVTCNIMLQAGTTISCTTKVDQHKMYDILSYIKNNELKNFEFFYKQSWSIHFLDFVESSPRMIPAGFENLTSTAEQKALTAFFMQQENSLSSYSNVAKSLMSKVIIDQNNVSCENWTPDVIQGVTKLMEEYPLSKSAQDMYLSLIQYFERAPSLTELKHISGIRQINNFKAITNNFNDISKLKPYQITYLHYCNWFYPRYVQMNEIAKARNLTITFEYPVTKIQKTIKIDSFGLYHSFIKDMKPGSLSTARQGGHLFLPDLQQATLSLSDFEVLDHGYFVAKVKQIDDTGIDLAEKTFFPVSNSDMENLEIVMDAIKNPKDIELDKAKSNESMNKFVFNLTNQLDQKFKVVVNNGIATFYRFQKKV
ncbi:hypothetical protein KBC04_02405 [Candidatus Babeliales bacterium]|nr:hypothetical protein [Candidatus Babeliales bacterium]MBP9843738.1 hypothetical protein [Candidatus Babeliales bacterium]